MGALAKQRPGAKPPHDKGFLSERKFILLDWKEIFRRKARKIIFHFLFLILDFGF
jgi:hypothetical protein